MKIEIRNIFLFLSINSKHCEPETAMNMRLEVAVNKIYKNSLYYQTTVSVPPLCSMEPADCVSDCVCVLHPRGGAMVSIIDDQLLLQKLIKNDK